MKRNIKIFIIIIFVFILLILGIQLWIYLDHTKAQKKLVVVRSYENTVVAIDENQNLYHVSFDNAEKQNVKSLKQGQEIEIYWHGMIDFMSPAGIGGVKKYKILKEKSDIEIPEYAIEYCYNSTENEKVEIENNEIENNETKKDKTVTFYTENSAKMKLIIVKAQENSLKTMDFNKNLYTVSLRDGDTSKFKQGQEVLIYYDGIVLTSYPGQITADKVEILKEKSDIEIPLEVLRYYNFLQKNISVEVEEISNTGINFKITDLNEIPLDYGKAYEYSIVKKNVENEEYNQNLEFDYNAYTPPVTTDTYSTTSSYSPDSNRLKKVWEEPELMGNEEDKICNWDSILDDGKIFVGKCNWINLYGKLESGEYEFKAYRTPEKVDDFFQCIIVKFIIDENGNITYEEPEFSF